MTTNIEWTDELLDGGASKTQAEWVLWCKETGTGVRLPTVKEYEALSDFTDSEFKEGIKEDLIRYWLMTADTIKNPFCGEKRPVLLGLCLYYRFVIDADYVDSIGPARGVRRKVRS